MSSHLPPVPTLEEARAEIEAEWKQDYEAALTVQANKRIAAAQSVHRQALRDERAERQAAAEDARIERDARKAWRKLFGRQIANQLEPFVKYDLLPFEDTYAAVRSEDAALVAELILLAGIAGTGATFSDVYGYRVGSKVQALAVVNPSPDQIEALGKRKAEAEALERQHKSRAEVAANEAQRERDLYGAAVSGDDEPTEVRRARSDGIVPDDSPLR